MGVVMEAADVSAGTSVPASAAAAYFPGVLSPTLFPDSNSTCAVMYAHAHAQAQLHDDERDEAGGSAVSSMDGQESSSCGGVLGVDDASAVGSSLVRGVSMGLSSTNGLSIGLSSGMKSAASSFLDDDDDDDDDIADWTTHTHAVLQRQQMYPYTDFPHLHTSPRPLVPLSPLHELSSPLLAQTYSSENVVDEQVRPYYDDLYDASVCMSGADDSVPPLVRSGSDTSDSSILRGLSVQREPSSSSSVMGLNESDESLESELGEAGEIAQQLGGSPLIHAPGNGAAMFAELFGSSPVRFPEVSAPQPLANEMSRGRANMTRAKRALEAVANDDETEQDVQRQQQQQQQQLQQREESASGAPRGSLCTSFHVKERKRGRKAISAARESRTCSPQVKRENLSTPPPVSQVTPALSAAPDNAPAYLVYHCSHTNKTRRLLLAEASAELSPEKRVYVLARALYGVLLSASTISNAIERRCNSAWEEPNGAVYEEKLSTKIRVPRLKSEYLALSSTAAAEAQLLASGAVSVLRPAVSAYTEKGSVQVVLSMRGVRFLLERCMYLNPALEHGASGANTRIERAEKLRAFIRNTLLPYMEKRNAALRGQQTHRVAISKFI